MARPVDPFPVGLLLSLDDIDCDELRLLVEAAGLSEREAQVWLTHQLSQIAPYAVGDACGEPLTQVAIAELVGCSKQTINSIFVAARRKVAAATGGSGYVVAGRGPQCAQEIPMEPSEVERLRRVR